MSEKIESDFALLDVMGGREALARRLQHGASVQVVVRGTIRKPWGSDDGTSQEFQLDVTSVEEDQEGL